MSNKLICAITLFAAVTLQVYAAHAEPAADALVTEAVPAEVSKSDTNLGRYRYHLEVKGDKVTVWRYLEKCLLKSI